MLPIVQRELQVAARSPKLSAGRVRGALLVILAATGMALMSQSGLRPGLAGNAFQTCSLLALLYCLAEGLRKTSDAISEEKRQGTLGLLFLTDLKGFDIVLGKLAAAGIQSFSGLLSFVPILAISILLGGTTGGEFWRTVLALCLSLGMSLSVCLLVSTLSRARSMSGSVAALLGMVFLPLIVGLMRGGTMGPWIRSLSPFGLFSAGTDAYYQRNPEAFWFGVAGSALACLIALGIASLALPHAWQDKPIKVRARGKRPRKRAEKRRAMLDRNPVMWLMFNPRSSRLLKGISWFGALAATLSIIGITFVLPRFAAGLPPGLELMGPALVSLAVVLVSSLYVARETSRNLAEVRENGALELMLSTPLRVSEIIVGQWLALRPALGHALLVLSALGFYVILATLSRQRPFEILILLKSFLEAVFGIAVIGWVGMWMGLTSKSTARAFLKTVVIGLILPHLFCTPTLVNQLTILIVAREKLKTHFRRFVAERYAQNSGFSLSPVPPGQPAAPPVLR